MLFRECLSLLGGVFTDLFVELVSIHVIVIVLLVYRTPTEIQINTLTLVTYKS